MSTDRIYTEDEVRLILERATTRTGVSKRQDTAGNGLTLAMIQDIGREVGMEPDRIAEAAATVASEREAVPRVTHLGAPVATGRIVDLPRNLTDREWEVLVAELRETFAARGHVSAEGGLRSWTNGNLHAYVEPTATGHRLRLGTRKGSGAPLLTLGASAAGLGLLMAGFFALEELGRAAVAFGGLVSTVGISIFTNQRLTLPSWAKKREAQMERISARARALTETAASED